MSDKAFNLVIVTPEREVYRQPVDSVSVPTVDGEITVLAHHVPLTTVLKAGELIIRQGQEEHPYVVGGGFAEIQADQLLILADTAEHVTDIDAAKAEEARAKGAALLAGERQDSEQYAALKAKLQRDLARIHVAKKYAHRGHHGINQEAVFKQ